MKKDIHPTYFKQATITCACGNKIKAGSTQENIQIEICSSCHPFFTGKAKLIDTAKRVNKFQKRLEKVTEAAKTRKGKKAKRAAKAKKHAAKKTTTKK